MQEQVWPEGVESFKKGPKRKYNALVKTDSPFLDSKDGLIKGGGRLAAAGLTFGRRHPILIPESGLGDALIEYLHHEGGHQGRKLDAALIRDQGYSPIGGRGRIQGIIRRCGICKVSRGEPMKQKMAELPEQRLWKTPPFYHCGMDVFGHFIISHGKHTRAQPGKRKVRVLLFTCLYSRAVHLEILEGITSESFRNALSRFENTRGECAYLRIDQGSNFMGVRNGSFNMCSGLASELIEEVQQDWEMRGKVWDLSPPTASHFGGVWERKIGQIRDILEGHLIASDRKLLSFEEFSTLLCLASRIVNSTALFESPDCSNDAMPITPHHLITQRDDACILPLACPETVSAEDAANYGGQRVKRIEQLAEEFEKHWKDYICEVGDRREKWNQPQPNARVGDMVLIMDKNLPRLQWATGTITEVYPSRRDNLVRRVEVRPHPRPGSRQVPRNLKRPIHSLVLIKSLVEQPPASHVEELGGSPEESAQVMVTMEPHRVRRDTWEIYLDHDETLCLKPDLADRRPGEYPWESASNDRLVIILPNDQAFLQESAKLMISEITRIREETKDTQLQKTTVSTTANPGVSNCAKDTPSLKKLNLNAKPWFPRRSPSKPKNTNRMEGYDRYMVNHEKATKGLQAVFPAQWQQIAAKFQKWCQKTCCRASGKETGKRARSPTRAFGGSQNSKPKPRREEARATGTPSEDSSTRNSVLGVAQI